MTDAEFSTFAKRLFITFPDVWEWLNANSPDPAETQRVWRGVLKDYRLDECLIAIEAWATGRKPIFKAYERAQIAILIRQSVQFERDKEAQRNKTNSSAGEYRKTRREDYKPLALNIPELAPIYLRGRKMRQDLLDGKISHEQYEEQKWKLLEEVQ